MDDANPRLGEGLRRVVHHVRGALAGIDHFQTEQQRAVILLAVDIPVLILYLEVTVAPDEARTHAPARDGFILNNHRRRSLFTEKLSHSHQWFSENRIDKLEFVNLKLFLSNHHSFL